MITDFQFLIDAKRQALKIAKGIRDKNKQPMNNENTAGQIPIDKISMTAKTPLSDLRKDALEHYEEASNAIHHWSSFVVHAIQNYVPDDFKESKSLPVVPEYEILEGWNSDGIHPWIQNICGNQDCAIHSVRRKDGEIFTVGDNVKSYYGGGHLKGSIKEIKSNGDVVCSNIIGEGNDWVRNICSTDPRMQIEKVKEPIFTTVDGITIYNKNEKLYVVECGKDVSMFEAKYEWEAGGNLKYFSNKQAAEEYVLENKLCLSVRDCRSMIVWPAISPTPDYHETFSRIRELADKRIKGK